LRLGRHGGLVLLRLRLQRQQTYGPAQLQMGCTVSLRMTASRIRFSSRLTNSTPVRDNSRTGPDLTWDRRRSPPDWLLPGRAVPVQNETFGSGEADPPGIGSRGGGYADEGVDADRNVATDEGDD
jgi:hypothetical protein